MKKLFVFGLFLLSIFFVSCGSETKKYKDNNSLEESQGGKLNQSENTYNNVPKRPCFEHYKDLGNKVIDLENLSLDGDMMDLRITRAALIELEKLNPCIKCPNECTSEEVIYYNNRQDLIESWIKALNSSIGF